MYFVFEIQNNTSTSYSFEDKATAFEKFFDIARYIPKSQLESHSVMITNGKGVNQFQPITKDAIN